MPLPLEGKQFSDAEIADHAPFSPADLRVVFLVQMAACSAVRGRTGGDGRELSRPRGGVARLDSC